MAPPDRSITVLTESELRPLVGLGDDELAAIGAVYPLISDGEVSMPPIQRIDVPDHRGEIDIKSAYLPGYDGIAVKVSAGFFDNPTLGLPSLGGLMLVFDSRTGVPRAALFDNGYLTDLRTALAGAVAADHLACPDSSTLGIVGAGVQARLQLEALRLVRPIDHVRVWARRPEAAREFCASVERELSLRAEPVDAPGDVIVGHGIVTTTTPATEPLLHADHLRPGVHITAVGSDAEHKQELDAGLLTEADVVVCDSRPQSELLGELRALLDADMSIDAIELGDVISGRADGRVDADQVTVCDLTGTGAQDTAIASLAVDRATTTGVGLVVDVS
jgi:ornithine cyclodeaminase